MPSQLRRSVALAADRDARVAAAASEPPLFAGPNFATIAKMKKPAPMGPALFILVAGAGFVLFLRSRLGYVSNRITPVSLIAVRQGHLANQATVFLSPRTNYVNYARISRHKM